MTTVDPKRSGVRAKFLAHVDEPECFLVNDRWFAEPGTMIPVVNHGSPGFNIACPGCGEIGSAREGQRWTVTAGRRDDVTTLTLSPSIHCIGCCGWHGYLVRGVFQLTPG